ncbi:MAG: serine/threonine protein kinase [Selenomonadaceae bacterium]|nr:serine/threonine protein kinase [Selenomonadaceae bacterium]
MKLADGQTATVVDKLGEGGQGIVYRVRLDSGEERALKWYFISLIKEPQRFYRHLESNIKVGSPAPEFVWPEQLTEWTADGTFGYVMKIFPSGYESFSKFLTAHAAFENVTAMVDAALNMVAAFNALHSKGYNYQDLNDGNFSINPANGKVLICDNDNIMGHGEYSGIEGKSGYVAPEVVRGEKQPDKLTDRYSLATLLFMLLVGNHPLEGARTVQIPALTNKFEKKIYGTKPLFIFDPNDDSNRPVRGLHQNAARMWKYFPSFIKDAFCRSFSQESLLNARGRLLEQDWFHVLVRLKSSIAQCPHCGEEIFLESDRPTVCQSCKKSVTPVGYFKFGKRSNLDVTVPIFKGVKLYDYHMNSSSEDFETVSAVVLEKPGKFGLQNKSALRWNLTTAGGKNYVCQPGAVQTLALNCKIDFGNRDIAQVVANS